jgi:hypothetical protein
MTMIGRVITVSAVAICLAASPVDAHCYGNRCSNNDNLGDYLLRNFATGAAIGAGAAIAGAILTPPPPAVIYMPQPGYTYPPLTFFCPAVNIWYPDIRTCPVPWTDGN